jgi:hypothetical protein
MGERQCLGVDGVRGGRGGARVAAGKAWRARKTASGRTKAAAGQRATRGVCREQEVALVGLQRRRAAAKSGSGR